MPRVPHIIDQQQTEKPARPQPHRADDQQAYDGDAREQPISTGAPIGIRGDEEQRDPAMGRGEKIDLPELDVRCPLDTEKAGQSGQPPGIYQEQQIKCRRDDPRRGRPGR